MMCRHCDRLVEDVDKKGIVHEFMAIVAARLKRSVDEIDIEFHVTQPSPTTRVYKLLNEMHK